MNTPSQGPGKAAVDNWIEAGKATRFGQPGGNKPGMTKERARLKLESEEAAARIQLKLLQAIEKQVDDVSASLETMDLSDSLAIQLVDSINKSTTLSLLKTIQDRELGTPRQSVDLSNSDGSFTPPVINIGFVSAPETKEEE